TRPVTRISPLAPGLGCFGPASAGFLAPGVEADDACGAPAVSPAAAAKTTPARREPASASRGTVRNRAATSPGTAPWTRAEADAGPGPPPGTSPASAAR